MSQALPRRLALRQMEHVPQIAVDVVDPRPAYHPLDAHPAEALAEVTQEADFLLGAGGVVHMPAFGGDGHPVVADPRQQGHAEAGAGGDQGAVAVRIGRPLLEKRNGVFLQHGDALRRGHQVVDQVHHRDPGLGRDLGAVHHPGQVGSACAVVDHRSRNAEAGRADLTLDRRTRGQEGRDQRRQTGKLGAAEPGGAHEAQAAVRHLEETEMALGAADVASQDHAAASTARSSPASPPATSPPSWTRSTVRPRCSRAWRSPSAWAAIRVPKV